MQMEQGLQQLLNDGACSCQIGIRAARDRGHGGHGYGSTTMLIFMLPCPAPQK